MMTSRINDEWISDVYEAQMERWPLMRDNFMALRHVKRRPVRLGDLHAYVQCNPARIVSTGAKVDPDSIGRRKCFLCAANRPEEQITTGWPDGWDLLINPYPIFPVHFTIAHTEHRPQDRVPLDMAVMAEQAPGLVIFFNGAHAGASAPDHMHTQAVLACELPLVRLTEIHHRSERPGFMSSEEFGLDLPFHFVSAIVSPDESGLETLKRIAGAFGIDAATGMPDRGLVNVFMWLDDTGLLRAVIVPRRRHRPLCYGNDEGRFLISPGAVDMAGVVITPRQEDYDRIDEVVLRRIYADVAFADRLPEISECDYYS